MQSRFLKARAVNKSIKISTKFASGKFEYFYIDLMDTNAQVRALFYIGHATETTMNKFYNDVQLDDIILLSNFIVLESDVVIV